MTAFSAAGLHNRVLRAAAAACVLFCLVALPACEATTAPSEVRRLLMEDDVRGAIGAAGKVTRADRPEAAEVLMDWVLDERDSGSPRLLAQVLALVIDLDPTATAAYEQLGVLVAETAYLGSYAKSGLSAWEQASRRHPGLREDPVFARAGNILAAAAGDNRPDVLCESDPTDQGTAPFGVVLDAKLPAGLSDLTLRGAAGGLVALLARSAGGRGTGLLVSAGDGAVVQRMDGCLDISLSPSGRYAAWVREPAGQQGLDCLVFEVSGGGLCSSFELETDRAGYLGLAWSPDETRIAVASDAGVGVLSLGDSPGRVVRGFRPGDSLWRVAGPPQWIGSDAVAVRVVSDDETAGRVLALDLASGKAHDVPVDAIRWSLQGVVWSPDGRYIACNVGDGRSRWVQVVQPVVGTAGDILAAYGEVQAEALAWSPDSSAVLLRMHSTGYSPPWGCLWLWTSATAETLFLCQDWVDSAIWGSDGVIYFAGANPYSGECRLTGASLTGLAAEVSRMLGEGRLDEALAAAAGAEPPDVRAVVATLVRWASEAPWGPTPPHASSARAFRSAAALDPACVAAYSGLAALLAQYPELGDPPGHVAKEALAAWEGASRSCPHLSEDPLFVRAGTVLGAAARPDNPGELAAKAAAGQLEAAGATTFLDHTVPAGLHVHDICGAAGGLVAYLATDQEGRHLCCAVSASDGAVKWRLEDCADLLLSPTGRYAAWIEPLPREGPREVFILDTRTAVSRSFATLGLTNLSDSAAWSPGEDRLAFTTGEGLVLIGFDGKGRRMLLPAGGEADPAQFPARPQWICGGRQVAVNTIAPFVPPAAYASIDPLRAVDVESGAVRRIPVEPVCWFLSGGVWSPDGKSIACDIGQDCPGWIQVVDADLAPAGDVLVTFGAVSSSVLSWSPDGTRLLSCMALRDEPLSAQLWVWERETGELKLLPCRGATGASWGQDGAVYWVVSDPESERSKLVGIRLD